MVDQRFAASVHILSLLAFEESQKPDALVTSDYLAGSVRTNPTVIRRLISRLSEAGLVRSYKGKTGGVKLAKAPEEISLKDVYLAASGKKLLNCSDKTPRKQCPVSCSMNELLTDVIDGLEAQSMTYLDSIALSELVSKIKS